MHFDSSGHGLLCKLATCKLYVDVLSMRCFASKIHSFSQQYERRYVCIRKCVLAEDIYVTRVIFDEGYESSLLHPVVWTCSGGTGGHGTRGGGQLPWIQPLQRVCPGNRVGRQDGSRCILTNFTMCFKQAFSVHFSTCSLILLPPQGWVTLLSPDISITTL